jgi:hypothetical protein
LPGEGFLEIDWEINQTVEKDVSASIVNELQNCVDTVQLMLENHWLLFVLKKF